MRLPAILAILLALTATAGIAAEGERWEKEWLALEAKDRASPPATGGICCVGSSSMRMWSTLAKDLEGLPVSNRAFGGSATADQLRALPRLVLPHRPRVVMYYCGDNDLASPTASATKPVEGFKAFVAALHKELPRARVVYLSIKPSPKRAACLPLSQEANRLIREWCAGDPLCSFIDVATPMLGADGAAKPELFSKDLLHMNADGYRLWTAAVKPVLEKVWAEALREQP